MQNATSKPVSRRLALHAPLALMTTALLSQPLSALASKPGTGLGPNLITVWKTPECGCCHEWVMHLRKNGFEVLTHDVPDTTPVRDKLGLPQQYGSCHTASLGAYVVEGHVPAQELRRLLREKPKARGLAVPGMPMGSPGMEMGHARDAYDVLLVLPDGKARVYQSYAARRA